MRLPCIELDVEGCRVRLLLPCSRLEEMYSAPLMAELEAIRLAWLRAWRRLAGLFEARCAPPMLKVVGGPLYMVHQNFIAGGAFSSVPMFLRFDGERFIAEFHRPVVAVNPYVYYFEGVAPRLVMQLPFVDEADVKLAREVGEEVDVLMEAPALWAERLVMEELGLPDRVEARLRLQEARDEALRALMEEQGLRVAGRPARWRTARLRAHLARLEGAGVEDVVGYVEAELRRLLKGLYEKLEEGLEVVVKDAAVEAPAVMGRTVERLAAWRMFLRRGFGYAEP